MSTSAFFNVYNGRSNSDKIHCNNVPGGSITEILMVRKRQNEVYIGFFYQIRGYYYV
jgi:hypothetical protein